MKIFGSTPTTRLIEEYHPLVSVVVLAVIGLLQFYDPPTYQALTDVSYLAPRKAGEDHYRKGPNDALFVFFIFNLVTVLRYAYRKLVLEPISRQLKLSKSLNRKFIDAGWFSMFFLVATIWGYFIFRDDAWWYSSPDLWSGYPHAFDYQMKYYYLASLAFWLQCLFSFFFEAPRKDDKAFFFHHLLTIALIVGSYRFNFFRVGAAILMEQNAADILYYHAKLFKYAGSNTIATTILVFFVFAWVYTRHFIFGWILYSLWVELPTFINVPGWDDETGYYYVEWLWAIFSIGLVALQLLMIYWFFLILRVIYRVIITGVTEDTTDASDSDEEEETEKKKTEKKKPEKIAKADKEKKGKDDKKRNSSALQDVWYQHRTIKRVILM